MKIILSFLFAILLPVLTYAQNSDEKFLFEKMTLVSEQFYRILNDEKNDAQMRREKIINEVIDLFDFELMARLSLDKDIRNSLTKKQYDEFTDIFESYIKNFYLDRLDLLKGTTSEVKESKQSKRNRIVVKAVLENKNGETSLVYKFYKTKEQMWLIYDVEIANVSILQSYRAQFSSYLSEHTFHDLLVKLKNKA